ncbi:hypothetical protein ABRZ08_13100 [Castellaniella ginsengisoli]|uniref:Uncharacterized protein n=1 Tax=Castellaniella ginsengisoli TaxID=546114 RepID=A0AB39G021_9BURK
MKIHDDHLYHGAALIQIAEHKRFTAINSLKVGRDVSRVAYCVNDNIAVYLKYATKPQGKFNEYTFTFNKDHITDLQKIHSKNEKAFIALVCVKDRQICCLSYEEFLRLQKAREDDAGKREDSLSVLVVAPPGKSLRVYVNAAGVKKMSVGKIILPRNRFPDVLFDL